MNVALESAADRGLRLIATTNLASGVLVVLGLGICLLP